MRFNLLITKRENNEIILDLWLEPYEAKNLFYTLYDGVNEKFYHLHVVNENNDLILEK